VKIGETGSAVLLDSDGNILFSQILTDHAKGAAGID
jgi:hypothetical protein